MQTERVRNATRRHREGGACRCIHTATRGQGCENLRELRCSNSEEDACQAATQRMPIQIRTMQRCVRTLKEHSSYVYDLAVCAGKLISASGDKAIKVWEPHADEVNSILPNLEKTISKNRQSSQESFRISSI